jgi:hypothetical protein
MAPSIGRENKRGAASESQELFYRGGLYQLQSKVVSMHSDRAAVKVDSISSIRRSYVFS